MPGGQGQQQGQQGSGGQGLGGQGLGGQGLGGQGLWPWLLQGSLPVSYTHLDVYKRQDSKIGFF